MEKSPLIRLLAELRNQIYGFTIREPGGQDIVIPRFDIVLRIETRPASRLALTQTCRQVRSECGELFFAVNTFSAFCSPTGFEREIVWLPNLRKWLETIGARDLVLPLNINAEILSVLNLTWVPSDDQKRLWKATRALVKLSAQ